LSVLFYAVRLAYSSGFVKYLDAETSPDLEPPMSDLPVNVSGTQLLSWSAVSSAERYVDTVGVFVAELPLQSHIDALNEAFSTQIPRV